MKRALSNYFFPTSICALPLPSPEHDFLPQSSTIKSSPHSKLSWVSRTGPIASCLAHVLHNALPGLGQKCLYFPYCLSHLDPSQWIAIMVVPNSITKFVHNPPRNDLIDLTPLTTSLQLSDIPKVPVHADAQCRLDIVMKET